MGGCRGSEGPASRHLARHECVPSPGPRSRSREGEGTFLQSCYKGSWAPSTLLIFIFLIFIGVELIYNVVLVPGVQQIE